jgi:hypothetical protein
MGAGISVPADVRQIGMVTKAIAAMNHPKMSQTSRLAAGNCS